MKLALELLHEEAIRLEQAIKNTGDATGIYSNKLDTVNTAIVELTLLLK